MSRIHIFPSERRQLAKHRGQSLIRSGKASGDGFCFGEDVAPDVLHQQRVVVARTLHDCELALPQVVAVCILLVKLESETTIVNSLLAKAYVQ